MRESIRITRKSASNLALSFVMLPRDRRDAMAALYAFCREVDDVADEDTRPVEKRREQLQFWRKDIRRACQQRNPELAVNRELEPVIRKHDLPCELFEALLDGVEMDLEKRRYANWQELDLYCYRVASVVGLLSIRVFGATGPACEAYAVNLGKALQLTNILRDVRVDSLRERIYLPQEELRRFGVPEEQIFQNRWSEQYAAMAAAIAERAETFYSAARAHLPAQERSRMIAAELMGTVYWRLLLKLRAARFDVFAPKTVGLSKQRKIALVLRAWAGFKLFGSTPVYGTRAEG